MPEALATVDRPHQAFRKASGDCRAAGKPAKSAATWLRCKARKGQRVALFRAQSRRAALKPVPTNPVPWSEPLAAAGPYIRGIDARIADWFISHCIRCIDRSPPRCAMTRWFDLFSEPSRPEKDTACLWSHALTPSGPCSGAQRAPRFAGTFAYHRLKRPASPFAMTTTHQTFSPPEVPPTFSAAI